MRKERNNEPACGSGLGGRACAQFPQPSSRIPKERDGQRPSPPPQPGHKARPHADRARQFMPFAALKGYYQLVREQERVEQPRRELTEDEALELSQRIRSLEKGQVVRVVHYEDGAYVTTQGALAGIDEALRTLRIVKRAIPFDEIQRIEPI